LKVVDVTAKDRLPRPLVAKTAVMRSPQTGAEEFESKTYLLRA